MPYFITARELARRGEIPAELKTDTQLIYNSPASLDFNSPGAQGFGVKRAGLALPGSIMLLISPACCGRNTAALAAPPDAQGISYGERFAYLLLDENDIVTGRHLQKIPRAVQAFVASRPEPPTCVLLCLTCADALLGTDMEGLAQQASAAAGLPVRPCYMYALTRESLRPPMVAVREMLYSLLEPTAKDPRACNLLGFFAPLAGTSELYSLLQTAGLRTINELSRLRTWQDYRQMAAANFNLVLNPEARRAAQAMQKRLQIPFIELKRVYGLEQITHQYQALAKLLGTSWELAAFAGAARNARDEFCARHKNEIFGIGSRLNGNAFDLALSLVRAGLTVAEIYGLPQPDDFFYIRELARLSPGTRIYTNLSVSMASYSESNSNVTFALGADAAYYHPHARKLLWNSERQPFGYLAVQELFTHMEATYHA